MQMYFIHPSSTVLSFSGWQGGGVLEPVPAVTLDEGPHGSAPTWACTWKNVHTPLRKALFTPGFKPGTSYCEATTLTSVSQNLINCLEAVPLSGGTVPRLPQLSLVLKQSQTTHSVPFSNLWTDHMTIAMELPFQSPHSKHKWPILNVT